MRPPEEVKREFLQQWLEKAAKDLELAAHLLGENAPYLDAIGFHAQQAAEKYLKALLVHYQIEFSKT
ncbi:MAG: HEPN domain-containing protein, partial [Candidatus Neomarinimicrobiota bacterium]